MSGWPNAVAVQAVLDWLDQPGTRSGVYESNRNDLLSAKFTRGGNRLRTFGPLMISLNLVNQFLLIRYLLSDRKPGGNANDGTLGYFLLQTGIRLRLELVQVIASEFKRSKRIQSLSGPSLYSPYIQKDDALAMLLAVSVGDIPTASGLASAFLANEAKFGSEIERPEIVLPTTAFAMRLIAACTDIDLAGSKYTLVSNEVYDRAIASLSSSDTDWQGAFTALCQHCRQQSMLNEDEDAEDYFTEYYTYPYQIYPVGPLAALVVRKLINPSNEDVLPFDVRCLDKISSVAMADDEVYQATCNVIRSGFPDFQFPSAKDDRERGGG